MNADTERITLKYWNMMRSAVAPEEFIKASILVNEVKNRFQGNNGCESSDEVYSALLEAADAIRVQNPFKDRDLFFLIYCESKKFNKMNWEEVMTQAAAVSRMPVLPPALIDLYRSRFSGKPETVLIAEAEKFVPNLQRIVDENINSHFVLTTQQSVYAKVLETIFAEYENVEVILSDIYRYEFLSRRFDLILSCPSFGGRTLVEDRNFICREFDMVALENLSLHLNNGGRLIITLPGRITFASGRVSDLRQFIQTNYTIKEIAELPEGTIDYCGIKVYLLDIENNRPGDEDIIIRRYSTEGRKAKRSSIDTLTVDEDTFVMLSELEEQGDWSLDRIFAQQDEDYLNYQRSDIRKDAIGNVAEVFRGKAITRKEPTGNIGVVNISNIGEYDVDYTGLDHLQEEERKVSTYILQEGDVLLPARGTAIRTAVFHEQSYPCIASANLIVIRPNPRQLDSIYLKIFLDSPIGNKIISGVQQGVAVMNISYKDLKVLEVPIPAIEEQRKIAEEYTKELTIYKETTLAAKERWNGVLERLQKF